MDVNALAKTYKSTALSSNVGLSKPKPKSIRNTWLSLSRTITFEVVRSPCTISASCIFAISWAKSFNDESFNSGEISSHHSLHYNFRNLIEGLPEFRTTFRVLPSINSRYRDLLAESTRNKLHFDESTQENYNKTYFGTWTSWFLHLIKQRASWSNLCLLILSSSSLTRYFFERRCLLIHRSPRKSTIFIVASAPRFIFALFPRMEHSPFPLLAEKEWPFSRKMLNSKLLQKRDWDLIEI